MKKLLMILALFLMMSGIVMGQTLTRTVTPSSVDTGEIFTITYTVTGTSGTYGGLIYENIPSGYAVQMNSFSSTTSFFDGQMNGQVFEMMFAGRYEGNTASFNLLAGPSSSTLTNGRVEWSSGGGTDNLPVGTLTITSGGGSCTSSWAYTSWGACTSSCTQTRTATDSNNCGTTAPDILSRSCTGGSCGSGQGSKPTLTRTSSAQSVAPGAEITLKYTIAASSGSYGGIIYENIPSGYSVKQNSFSKQSLTGFDGQMNGQVFEIVLVGSINGGWGEYKLIAGSTSASLTNGRVEWGDNLGTDTLPALTITVSQPSQTCSSQGGVVCSAIQTCNTGTVSATDTNSCCTGTCTTPTTGGGSGSGDGNETSCEVWQSEDATTGECGTASWVYIVGGLLIFFMVWSKL